MTNRTSLALPPSPNLITALRAGFDAISNNIALILFPIALDLLLWLGPHLRLTRFMEASLGQLASLEDLSAAGMAEFIESGREFWSFVAEQFNLLAALRSYPVGVTSLMVSRFPMRAPFGEPFSWELESLAVAVAAWLAITLLGLLAGTLYYSAVAQAALSGAVDWRQALAQWPKAGAQVLFLALLWAGIMLGAGIPGGFVVSLAALGGFTLGQCAVVMYACFLSWLLLPLLFSPHGIFVNQHNVYAALKNSARLTRLTFPSTALFFLIVILLSKGLDVLWLVPEETSWMTLIGVAGHAFVTTGLLASSFVYYRDADRWIRSVLLQKSLSTNVRLKA